MIYASEILDTAKNLVQKDRAEQHGDYHENFQNIATLWSAYLDQSISPEMVSVLLALMKIGRTKSGSYNKDDWIDSNGYLAIGGEIKSKEVDDKEYEKQRSYNTE